MALHKKKPGTDPSSAEPHDAGQEAAGEVKPTPQVKWAAGASEREIRLQYQGYTRAWIVHWGDGTREAGQPGDTLYHTYRTPGAYMAVVENAGGGTWLGQVQVVVQNGFAPVVEWGPAPDNPGIYQCRFGDVGNGIVPRHEIDWGDGSDSEMYWATPGTVAERALAPGTYNILIEDRSTKMFDYRGHTITGAVFDPDYTAEEDTSDSTRMTVKVTLTKTSSKALTITWGDKSTPTKVPSPKVGDVFTHKFPFANDFLVTAKYDDGTGKERGVFVTVPYADKA